MTTWLDHFVSGAFDRLLDAKRVGAYGLDQYSDADLEARFRIDLGIHRGDSVAAMRLMNAIIAAALPGEGGMASFTPRVAPIDAVIVAMTGPFLQTEAERLAAGGTPHLMTTALQVSPDLVAALAGARAPDTEDHMPDLARATGYIDLPHRALLLSATTQVRAIFTQPVPESANIRALVILTSPGSNRVTSYLYWTIFGPDAGPIGSDNATDVPDDHLRDRLAEFVKLVVLYRLSVPQACQEPLPSITPQTLSVSRKRQQLQKTRTIFKVVRLSPPADRFGRPNVVPGMAGHAGWRLDKRVEVDGHFRWQPHGTGRMDRKLIWNEPYMRGPRGAILAPTLEKVA
ncbi:hypothetical protein [Azospirillum brasilense]|uniref:Uncharacterized protein n=1 Tax=Azospirillum brasilense TaxID=192 RepID=A0A6L3ASB0_AZOBR|nr:hypothetical protein [Azospirillum brasilense]KAA0678186.1 hypothetical protein DS837_28115 [Azospirillum brasilense]